MMQFEMSPERSATLSKFNAEQTDWWAQCRKCHNVMSGTQDKLKQMRCEKCEARDG